MSKAKPQLLRSAKKGLVFDTTPVSLERWAQILKDLPGTPCDLEGLKKTIGRLYDDDKCDDRSRRFHLRRFAAGLRNPHLSVDDIAVVDECYSDSVPPLAGHLSSKHFALDFQLAPRVNPNPTKKFIDSTVAGKVLDQLEDWLAFYVNLLGIDPQFSLTDNQGRQMIQVFNLPCEDDGVTKFGCAMQLNSASMLDESNREFTTAHELFHCFQFAFGVDTKYSDLPDGEDWFVEGMANWAACLATKGLVDANWKDFSDFQTVPLFSDEYSAFPLWVYLSLMNKGSAEYEMYWAIPAFLKSFFDKGVSLNALHNVLSVAASTTGGMPTGIAPLIAYYSCAKGSTQWRALGYPYFRHDQAEPPFDKFYSYIGGEPYPVPSLNYTDNATFSSAPDSLTFDDMTVREGCASILKVNFGEPVEYHSLISLTLKRTSGKAPLVMSVSILGGDVQLEPGGATTLSADQPSVNDEWLVIMSNDATGLCISVVDGTIGGAPEGDIGYSLKVQLKGPFEQA